MTPSIKIIVCVAAFLFIAFILVDPRKLSNFPDDDPPKKDHKKSLTSNTNDLGDKHD